MSSRQPVAARSVGIVGEIGLIDSVGVRTSSCSVIGGGVADSQVPAAVIELSSGPKRGDLPIFRGRVRRRDRQEVGFVCLMVQCCLIIISPILDNDDHVNS